MLQLFSLVASSTVRGSLLLVAAFVVSLLLRRQSAALRHAVLGTALSAQLLIPLATVLAPSSLSSLVPSALRAFLTRADSRVSVAPLVRDSLASLGVQPSATTATPQLPGVTSPASTPDVSWSLVAAFWLT